MGHCGIFLGLFVFPFSQTHRDHSVGNIEASGPTQENSYTWLFLLHGGVCACVFVHSHGIRLLS